MRNLRSSCLAWVDGLRTKAFAWFHWGAMGLGLAVTPVAVHATDLTMLSLEQLMDVSITGASKYAQKQHEVAAAASVITRSDIKAFGWRTLVEALASLPGIYTTYDRQYQYLGLRGLGIPGDLTARVLITINGDRVNDPTFDSGPVGREFSVDMDMVERIEFIPGPGGAVYGQNAMFGVVNVVTRSGAGIAGTELTVGYQSPQALREVRINWGRIFDSGMDVAASASGFKARGEDRAYEFGSSGISGVAQGLDAEKDQKLFLRAQYGDWNVQLTHSDRRKDDPAGGYLSDPLVAGAYSRDIHRGASLNYHHHFEQEKVQLAARWFGGSYRFRSQLNYSSPVSFPAEADWHGLEARAVFTGLERHTMMLGMEVQKNLRTNQSVLYAADPAQNVRIASSGRRMGLYFQDEWRWNEHLRATLGVRGDNNLATGTHLSPRVGLIWHAAAFTTLKLLYGRAHRSPNAFERDYDDGIAQVANPLLSAESIDTLEGVLDHRVRPDLSWRLAVYQWETGDLIVLGTDAVTGLAQYHSGGTVRAHGMEMSADKTWRAGARARGSISLQHTHTESGQGMPNSPTVLSKLNVSTPLGPRWRAGYELRHDSRRLSVNGDLLGSYVVSNLILSTEIQKIGLSVAVQNLFNKRYAQPGADTNWQNSFEQDGRTLRAQLTYRF